MLAKNVNDNACSLNKSGACEFFASKLAPTGISASTLHEVAYRAIHHYLNPEKPSPEPSEGLFTVRADLGTETLLVNASQDLASISDIATHLAFEIDGAQRNVALGLCRMLEGVQLLVDKALDEAHPAA